MIKKMLCFIFLPILLTTCGEFFLKHHINLVSNEVINTYSLLGMDITLNLGVVLSLVAIVAGGVLWVVAMSKFELSFLYPFLSINYIAIILGSQLFLNEQVSFYRYISIALIIIGLIFISRSPNSTK